MENIRKHFEKAIQQKLKDVEWTFFMSKLCRWEFPKKHKLLQKGQVEDYLSFVETGIVRYYIPKIENDITFTFVFGNHFMSAYDSFISRSPSNYSIETLDKTTLWRLKYKDLQSIYQKTEIGNLIGRKASEALYLKKINRELSLLNETAEERYRNLFSQQPELIRHIPLKYIASYIGVTPQALSRIRKRIY